MDELFFGVSAAGEPVAECEIDPADVGRLPAVAGQAVHGGAKRLWVHCTADLSDLGFTACDGYRRFTANTCPAGDPLPVVDTDTAAVLLRQCYIGQWGHKQVDQQWASSPDAVYVGLRQDGEWTGLCRVEPEHRLIDGPGFPGRPRTAEAVAALVRGACALLGEGPVTVETWGEPADPYVAIGLQLVKETGGWERILAG